MNYNPYLYNPGFNMPFQNMQMNTNLKKNNNKIIFSVFTVIIILIIIIYYLYSNGYIFGSKKNIKEKLNDFINGISCGDFLVFYHINNKSLSSLDNIENELGFENISAMNDYILQNTGINGYKDLIIEKKYDGCVEYWKEKRKELYINSSNSCNFISNKPEFFTSPENTAEMRIQGLNKSIYLETLNTKNRLNSLKDKSFMNDLFNKQQECAIQFKTEINKFISTYSCNKIDNINSDSKYTDPNNIK